MSYYCKKVVEVHNIVVLHVVQRVIDIHYAHMYAINIVEMCLRTYAHICVKFYKTHCAADIYSSPVTIVIISEELI